MQESVERKSRALITFGYAHVDDDDWSALAVSSREMMAVERQTKGFTANSFFTDVSISGLYRIAYVVLKVRGEVDKAVSFDLFVDTYDVKLRDPSAPEDEASDDDEDDETGSEADPTHAAA